MKTPQRFARRLAFAAILCASPNASGEDQPAQDEVEAEGSGGDQAPGTTTGDAPAAELSGGEAQPAPAQPGPAEPGPAESGPAQPGPAQPAPAQPAPAQPAAPQPEGASPKATTTVPLSSQARSEPMSPTRASTPPKIPSDNRPDAVTQKRVVVLDLRNDGGVSKDTVRLIQDALTVSLTKKKSLEVVSSEDIRRIISLEADREAMGCSADASCLAELASALGAELVVYGSVGQLGMTTVINVSVFDSLRTRSVARETIEANTLEVIPDRIRGAVDAMLGKDPVNPFASPWLYAGPTLGVLGGAGAVVLGVLASEQISVLTDSSKPLTERNDARALSLGLVGGAAIASVVGVAGLLSTGFAFSD